MFRVAKPDPEAQLHRLVSSQLGLVSLSQVRSLGVDDSTFYRMVRKGIFSRELPGIYVLAALPTSSERSLMAAMLWSAPDGVLSHWSAGMVHGLNVPVSEQVHIILRCRTKPPAAHIKVHIAKLHRREIQRVDGFRVTDPYRTLIDLASTAQEEELEHVLETALGAGLVTPRRLASHARSQPKGKRGRSKLLHLLDDRPVGASATESFLEVKMDRLLRQGSFPRPVRQLEIMEQGRVAARLDFAFPERKLAIEVDGYAFHSDRQAWARDRARDNYLQSEGWMVLRYTHKDLIERPSWVLDEVAKAYFHRQGGDLGRNLPHI